MKYKVILLFAIFTALFGLNSCSKTEQKPATESAVKSVVLANLQAAFNGESNASNKYKLFAAKAEEEGFKEVAVLLRAASHAEEVHAANHSKVIKSMGGVAEAKIDPVTPKTTKENLQAAIDGETYEFTKMYPEFVENAKKEKNMDALRTFNLAMTVEKEHAKLYTEALNNLESWKQATKSVFVCPVCGWTTFDKTQNPCPVCATSKDMFLEFK